MSVPHGGKLVQRIATEKEKPRLKEEANSLPQLIIQDGLVRDAENIAKGVFSPLEGFMNRDDLQHVLDSMRLSDDTPWTIPIVLDAPPSFIDKIKVGDQISLSNPKGHLSILDIEEMYTYDKEDFAKKVYQTSDLKHPGVTKTRNQHDILIGGKITLISSSVDQFHQFDLSPVETRILFKEKGWRTIAGFQTRNPPHLGHEYVQKTALTFVDGLFINPVIGKKKKGDFKDEIILKSYQTLMDYYYLKQNAVMSILKFEMRYAGPREAILHAIARKNFGCTHFIIGRDHAGVGNYYGPYDAQEIFSEFPDLDITPFFFRSFFYCKKCGTIANEKTCPHPSSEYVNFSGTKIRGLLQRHEKPSPQIMRSEVADIIIQAENPFIK